jgi:two-component system CheB/CheR fusion protein
MPPADAPATSEPDRVPPVAGIGASAGGLDAFKKLLVAMPPDSGIACVLIPHLDPAHESLMVELLARHTAMPVVEVKDGMPVEANHVYVIPPNKYMTIHGGVLRLTGPVERHGAQTSIDLFLRSLADDQQTRSICIILSGTGSHGALGLKAVKAAGGMAMVQDPATAQYNVMPQSAIATGLADYVLPVEQMPEAMLKYIQHFNVNGGKAGAEGAEPPELNQLLALVRTRTKLDFRSYRKKMLARRVERRMSLSQLTEIADYLAFLREHPDEVRHLSRDLLISVTGFFRDPEAWLVLKDDVIAPLVSAKEHDAPLRVWSVGCATGEEPYSLGMLLLEQLTALQKNCPVQIFATDIDEDALEFARRAIYPENISADISPERLARFFTRVSDSSYQVSKQLRETVTFARQNLIADAPFSKLDLVVCRNLLIYLEPEVQKRVIALLHFAVTEGGVLFLGSSETIGRRIDLFQPISAKRRIYRRIGLTQMNNLQFPAMEPEPRQAWAQPAKVPQPTQRLAELAHNSLLRRYALAYVVINRNYEVLHFAGPTEDYLAQPGGPPTHDLLSLARPGLESKLRVVIQRAIRQNMVQSVKGVMMRHATIIRRVNVDVEPLNQSKQAEGLLLISFQGQPNVAGESSPEAKASTQTADSDMVRQLEQELESTREDLQSAIEELESSSEELKASNEETMSTNEELQSTNEELETSKEELQSLNEELTTVNSQLHEKVQELETANNDMANLFQCTEIAMLFLDRALRIKRFTPETIRLFNVIDSDVGRPIGDIVRRFSDDELLSDAKQLLRDLTPREREVRTEDGRWCARRIMPYRTLDNRIDGVVITFVDITERKKAADAIDEARLYSEGIVETIRDPLIVLDGTLRVQSCNPAFYEMFHTGARETVGHLLYELGNHEWDIPELRRLLEDILPHQTRATGFAVAHEFKDLGERTMLLTARMIPRPGGREHQILLAIEDATDRIKAENQLKRINVDLEQQVAERTQSIREREERLQGILNTAADAIITIDRTGVIQSVNHATEQMFGYAAAEMLGQNVSMLMPSPHREVHDFYMARYQQTREKHIIGISRDVEARRKDGTIFPTELAVSEIEHLGLFTGIHRDLTERKQLERDVVEAASMEQRRIGEDLHDSVAQELTALNLLTRDLTETLRTDPANASQLVERIAQGLQRSQQELRDVLRGLLPVAVDSEGLMAALSDLADHTQQERRVSCRFDCPEPVTVADNLAATQLYFIAQEAVHNAVKHAQSQNIRITLVIADANMALSVQDDGIGVSIQPAETQGLGVRIMRNRAAILGARLTIEPAAPTGTVVKCVLTRKTDEQEKSGKKGQGRDR